jgi:hypothetical protein
MDKALFEQFQRTMTSERTDGAPPVMFRCPRSTDDSPGLPCRCIFSNHCLCIRLLGLPAGSEISRCFAGCSGMLLVSHGSLELRSQSGKTNLTEGESVPLPLPEPTELWPAEATDVLYFERRLQ